MAKRKPKPKKTTESAPPPEPLGADGPALDEELWDMTNRESNEAYATAAAGRTGPRTPPGGRGYVLKLTGITRKPGIVKNGETCNQIRVAFEVVTPAEGAQCHAGYKWSEFFDTRKNTGWKKEPVEIMAGFLTDLTGGAAKTIGVAVAEAEALIGQFFTAEIVETPSKNPKYPQPNRSLYIRDRVGFTAEDGAEDGAVAADGNGLAVGHRVWVNDPLLEKGGYEGQIVAIDHSLESAVITSKDYEDSEYDLSDLSPA